MTAEFFHSVRRTDKHDDAHIRFSHLFGEDVYSRP